MNLEAIDALDELDACIRAASMAASAIEDESERGAIEELLTLIGQSASKVREPVEAARRAPLWGE